MRESAVEADNAISACHQPLYGDLNTVRKDISIGTQPLPTEQVIVLKKTRAKCYNFTKVFLKLHAPEKTHK